jgi:hypothetical protein
MAIVIRTDNTVIWAGPITTRTYQSQAQVVSMNMESYESIFAGVKVLTDFERKATDQLTIFKDLITAMQAQPYNNFGLDTSSIGTSGVLRDIKVRAYEDKFFADPIDELLKQTDSFDYVIDPYFDANEQLQLRVRAGYPYLGYGQDGIWVDYPGPVSNYYFPESFAKGGTRHTFVGRGEGSSMRRATVVNQDLLDQGYPAWDKVMADKSVSDQAVVTRMARQAAAQYKLPVVTPTIEIKPDEFIEWAEWNNLGVPLHTVVEDARFPSQHTFGRRMLGWDLTPSSSENVEELKLVLEGDE